MRLRPRAAFAAALLSAALLAAAVATGALAPSPLAAWRAAGGGPPAPEGSGGADRAGPERDPGTARPGGAGSVEVVVHTPGFWSWAMLDRSTGVIVSGPGEPEATLSTESMIKVWIVADRLRTLSEAGIAVPEPELALARVAIRDSDDQAAETLYRVGGGDAVIERLIRVCGLTGTTAYPGWWSRTEMSATDAVRMGLCVADGRAAGPDWTDWLLEEMRQVRGGTAAADQPHGGRWGIIDALPADQAARLAIKNGWTPILADGTWHVNCLAIADSWIMAVQARYPIELGLDHGAWVCAEVAGQLLGRPES